MNSNKSRRRKVHGGDQVTVGKILLMIVLILLLGSVIRMTILMNKKLLLVNERKNMAAVELAEIENLASELEQQAQELYSEEGVKKVLRERYGLVGENEGYILLTDEHPGQLPPQESESWWKLW